MAKKARSILLGHDIFQLAQLYKLWSSSAPCSECNSNRKRARHVNCRRLEVLAKKKEKEKKIGRNFRDCRQNVGKKEGEKRSRETARQAEKPHTHTAAIIFFLSPFAALASSVTLPLTSGLIVPEQRVLYQVYNTSSRDF